MKQNRKRAVQASAQPRPPFGPEIYRYEWSFFRTAQPRPTRTVPSRPIVEGSGTTLCGGPPPGSEPTKPVTAERLPLAGRIMSAAMNDAVQPPVEFSWKSLSGRLLASFVVIVKVSN